MTEREAIIHALEADGYCVLTPKQVADLIATAKTKAAFGAPALRYQVLSLVGKKPT